MMEQATSQTCACVMRAEGVYKQYPGTLALNNVDFKVYRGKVNALIGENGAGKSTLMKICAGIEQPSKGTLYINEKPVTLLGARSAAEHGIGMIHQELNFFANMTVAENIFAGKELRRHLVLDRKKQIEEANRVLTSLQQPISATELMVNLRVGQQQIVEIAKSVINENLQVLIMDEPTSSLSNTEVEVLFQLIEDLKQRGIAIIYISHRLEEIKRISDFVTVLRNGVKVGEAATKDIDIPWIVKCMVGDKSTHIEHEPYDGERTEMMRLEHIRLPKVGGGMLIDDVNLSLYSGEVLGIYGLMGAGRTELIECIMGMHAECSGEFTFFGKKSRPRSIAGQIHKGIASIPEDRQVYGLVQTMSIEENMILMSAKSHTKFHVLSSKSIARDVRKMIQTLQIKIGKPSDLVTSLSGGNQQKVVIGKVLLSGPRIILFDEPSRGIDIGAKSDVFRIMRRFAQEGMGIIFVGSELKEILDVCDRVIVMSKGKVAGEFSGKEMTEETLVLATGEGKKVEGGAHNVDS